jgi:multisubunit Na+/H+ antiporter MnhB subunit
MKAKQLAGALIGAFIGSLGLLWFLQGTGILRMRPILCIANCEEIVGPSPVWAVSGLIALVIGVIVVFASMRHVRAP